MLLYKSFYLEECRKQVPLILCSVNGRSQGLALVEWLEKSVKAIFLASCSWLFLRGSTTRLARTSSFGLA